MQKVDNIVEAMKRCLGPSLEQRMNLVGKIRDHYNYLCKKAVNTASKPVPCGCFSFSMCFTTSTCLLQASCWVTENAGAKASDDDEEVAPGQYVCSVNDIFDVAISDYCLIAT